MRPLPALAVIATAVLAGALGVAASVVIAGPDALLRSPLAPLLERWLGAHAGTLDIGDRLPPLELPQLDGQARRRLPTPGRVVLINYWASWCGPCRGEMPLLDTLARQAPAGLKLEVVGVALDEAADAQAFLRGTPVGFPVLVEAPGAADDSSARLGNRGVLPFSVLIDADGRLRARRYGAFSGRDDLEDWIRNAQLTRN